MSRFLVSPGKKTTCITAHAPTCRTLASPKIGISVTLIVLIFKGQLAPLLAAVGRLDYFLMHVDHNIRSNGGSWGVNVVVPKNNCRSLLKFDERMISRYSSRVLAFHCLVLIANSSGLQMHSSTTIWAALHHMSH